MSDKSLINNYQEKDIHDYSSNAILREIQNFIDNEHDVLKFESTSKGKNNLSQLIWNNKWYAIILATAILCLFALPIIALLENPNQAFFILLSFVLLLELVFIIGLLIKYFTAAKKGYKAIRAKAIYRVSQYNLDKYYKLISYLGSNFYKDDLSREEIRFKVIINQKNSQKSFVKTIGLFVALFLVVVSIWILGFPNNNQITNILYGAIVGVSGIVVAIKNIWDVYLEVLYQDVGIYEQCVLILQEAQKIAAEEDADDIYAYDRAIAANDEAIPFEQATFEIDNNV